MRSPNRRENRYASPAAKTLLMNECAVDAAKRNQQTNLIEDVDSVKNVERPCAKNALTREPIQNGSAPNAIN